jgi:protein-L-isoaspartate(D-aspartate) O-methyltransferase
VRSNYLVAPKPQKKGSKCQPPGQAPFDRIILTAAPPELPQVIVNQLKPGGKLLAPVGRAVFNQAIMLVEKAPDGKITSRSLLPVSFVPMVKPPPR